MPLRAVKRLAKRTINRARSRLGYRVERLADVEFLEPLLYRRLRQTDDFFFVQIGANDGVTYDPIYRFVTSNRVAGIVVEPLNDAFGKLVDNYRHYPRIVPVNVALHATAKSMDMYRVDPSAEADLPAWAVGVASFDPEHHRRTGLPSEAIISERVECMSWEELASRYHIGKIDLLQIDTEGYDREVLEMAFEGGAEPRIVHFEHGLTDGIMRLDEFKECMNALYDRGYFTIVEEHDCIAYKPQCLAPR